MSADIDSHLFKNHLNVIQDRQEVESEISIKKYYGNFFTMEQNMVGQFLK